MTDIVENAQAETVVTSEREPTFGETLQSAASFCESLKRQGSADQWDFDYLIGKFRDAAFAVSLWDKAREGWLAEIASQARRIAELETFYRAVAHAAGDLDQLPDSHAFEIVWASGDEDGNPAPEDPFITAGMIRRARATLKGETP